MKNASYTVLRSTFDRWLASKAEEAGAEIIPGILVDKLIVEDGKSDRSFCNRRRIIC